MRCGCGRQFLNPILEPVQGDVPTETTSCGFGRCLCTRKTAWSSGWKEHRAQDKVNWVLVLLSVWSCVVPNFSEHLFPYLLSDKVGPCNL